MRLFKRNAADIHGENPGVPKRVSKGLRLIVCGTDNVVEIDPTSSFAGCIMIGTRDCPVHGCRVTVGARTLANDCTIVLMEDESELRIGEDCLISAGVRIWCSDSHSVLDGEGRLLNRGRFVRIGRHVWIGLGVLIGKNVSVADDSILGMGAVVTGDCAETSCAYGGNPARLLKRDIRWSKERPMAVIRRSEGGAR